jgi:uncharacterized membrane protein YdjX (TVP38/TMEM64 family)
VVLLSFFPVVPHVVLAGMIGSVLGIWIGAVISLIGIGLETMIMFYSFSLRIPRMVSILSKKIPGNKRIRKFV